MHIGFESKDAYIEREVNRYLNENQFIEIYMSDQDV